MKIEIAGWSLSGFRCPDMEISLVKDNEVAPISLIQMPNGTGKTTTLELLKATLNGEAVKNWTPSFISSFQGRDNANSMGKFIVNLLIDGEPLTFDLTLNYEEGHARCTTTSPGSGGAVRGWQPPRKVMKFLSSEFIDLFVFDGEYADRLLDSKESEAQRSIDALCQLYLLDEIIEVAENAWENAARSKGPSTKTGLSKYQNQEDDIKKRISDLNRIRVKAEKEHQSLGGEIKILEKKIDEHMSSIQSISDQYELAKEELSRSKDELSEACSAVMHEIRSPYTLHNQFCNSLVALKNNLDKLKLPENSSAQFFEELIEQDVCICGREMDSSARKHIRVCARQYLGEDEAGVINAIKNNVWLL